MSGTLISNNLTIKINTSVYAKHNGIGTTLLYTVPANSYLLFNAYVLMASDGTGYLSIGASPFEVQIISAPNNFQGSVFGVVAGPGQTIYAVSAGGTNPRELSIAGVLFTNTP